MSSLHDVHLTTCSLSSVSVSSSSYRTFLVSFILLIVCLFLSPSCHVPHHRHDISSSSPSFPINIMFISARPLTVIKSQYRIINVDVTYTDSDLSDSALYRSTSPLVPSLSRSHYEIAQFDIVFDQPLYINSLSIVDVNYFLTLHRFHRQIYYALTRLVCNTSMSEDETFHLKNPFFNDDTLSSSPYLIIESFPEDYNRPHSNSFLSEELVNDEINTVHEAMDELLPGALPSSTSSIRNPMHMFATHAAAKAEFFWLKTVA